MTTPTVCPDRRSRPNPTRTVSDQFAQSWLIWRHRHRSVKLKVASWRNRKPGRSTWSLRWTHTHMHACTQTWISKWLGLFYYKTNHQTKASTPSSRKPVTVRMPCFYAPNCWVGTRTWRPSRRDCLATVGCRGHIPAPHCLRTLSQRKNPPRSLGVWRSLPLHPPPPRMPEAASRKKERRAASRGPSCSSRAADRKRQLEGTQPSGQLMFSVKQQSGCEAFKVCGREDYQWSLSLKRLTMKRPSVCFKVKDLLPVTSSGTSSKEVAAVLCNFTRVWGLSCQPYIR